MYKDFCAWCWKPVTHPEKPPKGKALVCSNQCLTSLWLFNNLYKGSTRRAKGIEIPSQEKKD